MLDKVIVRIRGLLTRPVDTFREAKNDPQNDVLLYVFLLIVFSTLMGILVAVAGLAPAGRVWIETPVLIPVALVIGSFLGTVSMILVSVWVHLCAWVCGGRQPSGRSLIATGYSSTPSLLFGWIPFIGPVFMLWSLVLLVLGVRECQEMTLQRAVLAVFAAILPVIVLVAVTFLMPETFSLVPEPSLGNGFVIIHTK
jgi:hypothetical protein